MKVLKKTQERELYGEAMCWCKLVFTRDRTTNGKYPVVNSATA